MKSSSHLEQLLAMLISVGDLRKLDDGHLKSLSHEQLLELSKQVVRDLKEARDRLNQNPDNSSRPPSTQAPWAGVGLSDGDIEASERSSPCVGEQAKAREGTEARRGQRDGKKPRQERRRAGRQPGARCHGRKLEMAVTGVVTHRAARCARCGALLEASAPFTPSTVSMSSISRWARPPLPARGLATPNISTVKRSAAVGTSSPPLSLGAVRRMPNGECRRVTGVSPSVPAMAIFDAAARALPGR